MKERLLITGSSGMIGTALCEELLKRKIDFVGIDKVPNRWNSKVNDKTINMDLLDVVRLEILIDEMQKSDPFTKIIHLAANARVWELVLDTSRAVENVAMVNSVYEIAKRTGIKKVILASSREVYGEALQDDTKRKLKETDALISNCSNQYAASKIFLEAMASANRVVAGIDSVVLRFSNVYGRYDTSNRFIPLVIERFLRNVDIDIYGHDKKSMDFTYIDDTVAGILLTVEKFDKMKVSKKNMGVYNVSSGKTTSLFNVASIILSELKGKSKINLCDNRPGEPMYYVADISRMKKMGYKPAVSIYEGLIRSIKYYKKLYA